MPKPNSPDPSGASATGRSVGDDEAPDTQRDPVTAQSVDSPRSDAPASSDESAQSTDESAQSSDESEDREFVGTGVPAVVAVIPTRDPGEWFDEALSSLAAQDYANLACLVVDAGSVEDPTPRVADRLPSAFVRRTATRLQFAAAANEALGSVEGAVFYLFLHDDVALGPDVVQAMVTEAFRSNAGVVGAKFVDWDQPDRIRNVGAAVDKFGFLAPLSDPDELDQAQHDAVQDVFVVSSAAMLVRADLFEDLGGFSTDIPGYGEDLDLCWRARVAGARVIVMPAAVVRHREGSTLAEPIGDEHHLALRHQARVMLACYSPFSLLRVGPQAVIYSLIDVIVQLVTGRLRQALDVVTAWTWNIAHIPKTLRIRSRVKRSRRVPDSDVRAYQVHGSARLNGFLRGARSASEQRLPAAFAAARDLPTSWQRGTPAIGAGAAVVVAVVYLLGSRHLITDGVPALREVSPMGNIGDLVQGWWAGWLPTGMGRALSSPSIFAVFGLANVVTFNSPGLVHTFWVLSLIPLGALGAWRLLRGVASGWSRLATLVAYLVVPLPYDAIAEGRMQALALYAAMPWILGRLLRASGVEPFDHGGRSAAGHGVGLALVLVAAALIAPIVALVTAAVALVSAVVLALSGRARGGVRILITTVVGLGLSALVLAPDVVAALRGHDPIGTLIGGRSPAPTDLELGDLLRMTTGSARGGIVLAATSFVALGVLVLGARWRLRWGAVAWAITLTTFTAVVVVGRTDWEGGVPSLATLIAPGAVGLALAVGLGAQAVQTDVLGGQFGWRQLIAVLGGAVLVIGTVPLIVASANGRWEMPDEDAGAVLATLHPEGVANFRALWIGDPDVLPMRSRELVEGVGWAVVDGVVPSMTSQARIGDGHGEDELEAALRDVIDRGPGRLASVLAPYGIRYTVVLEAPNPGSGRPPSAQVAAIEDVLAQQLDLDALDVAPGLLVYESQTSGPLRSVSSGEPGAPVSPALEEGDEPVRFEGPLDDGTRLRVAENRDESWHLEVDGTAIAQQGGGDGWSQAYNIERGGPATLGFRAPPTHRLLLVAQLVALLAVAATARRSKRAAAGTDDLGAMPTETDEPREPNDPADEADAEAEPHADTVVDA